MKAKTTYGGLKLFSLLIAFLAAATFCAKMVIATDAGAGEKKSAGFVGTDTCITCHEGYGKSFMTTKHSALFKDLSKKGDKAGCEACHGAAEKHLDDPGQGVARFGQMKPAAIGETCLKCHEAGKMAWRISLHAKGDISCVNCHSVHGAKKASGKKDIDKSKNDTEALLKDGEPDLCLSCHKEKANDINMPSHHPVKQGKVACSDCHGPHTNSVLEMDRAGEKCVKCHPEKIGPFTYEHTPVVDGCLTCHKPHGSVNQDLLTIRQPALCLQCHASTPMTHDTAKSSYKNCVGCHSSIHGSNGSEKFMSR